MKYIIYIFCFLISLSCHAELLDSQKLLALLDPGYNSWSVRSDKDALSLAFEVKTRKFIGGESKVMLRKYIKFNLNTSSFTESYSLVGEDKINQNVSLWENLSSSSKPQLCPPCNKNWSYDSQTQSIHFMENDRVSRVVPVDRNLFLIQNNNLKALPIWCEHPKTLWLTDSASSSYFTQIFNEDMMKIRDTFPHGSPSVRTYINVSDTSQKLTFILPEDSVCWIDSEQNLYSLTQHGELLKNNIYQYTILLSGNNEENLKHYLNLSFSDIPIFVANQKIYICFEPNKNVSLTNIYCHDLKTKKTTCLYNFINDVDIYKLLNFEKQFEFKTLYPK